MSDTVLLNPTDVAWCAGFFDGEGSTSRHHKTNLRVSVGQKERGLLERFVSTFQVGKIYVYKSRQFFSFETCNTAHSSYILAQMWPYLGPIKKAQAIRAGYVEKL